MKKLKDNSKTVTEKNEERCLKKKKKLKVVSGYRKKHEK